MTEHPAYDEEVRRREAAEAHANRLAGERDRLAARVAELERELTEVKEECRSWAQNGEREHARLQQATEALRAIAKLGVYKGATYITSDAHAKALEIARGTLAALAGDHGVHALTGDDDEK